MSKLKELLDRLCPEGVEYKNLGSLGIFFGGLTGKSKNDFQEGNAKLITYLNVYSNIGLKLDGEDTVKIVDGERQSTLQYGDIVFTGSSETPDECGISSVVTQPISEEIYLNSFCFFFRFNDLNIMLPDFAKHLFRSSELRYQIGKTARGVTRFNVSKKLMEDVIIPIPPIPVQQEIARILDNFTELMGELMGELTARERQYIYYREKVLKFENNIVHKPLREVASFRNGKGHEKDISTDGTYVVVNSKFISTGGAVRKFSDKQLSPLFKGDILIVMSDLPNGRALAKCFLVEEDGKYTLNQRIGALHSLDEHKLSTKYLFYILDRNRQLLKYDNGVDQTNLKKDNILDISIPMPSPDEQKRVVKILDTFNTLCSDLNIGLPAEIEARKKQYEYYRDKLLTFKEKEV